MPMYEYTCLDCGEEFEELVRSSDEQVECEACESEKVKRKMSTFAAHTGGHTLGSMPPPSGGASKCSGCSGGNCASC